MSNKQPQRRSTIHLLFGLCPAWQLRGGNYNEIPSLLEAKGTGDTFDYAGSYQGDDFLTSKFWKNFVRRMWQLDDFSFEGLAAASYLPGAHRFKIWFNPFSFYEFCMKCALSNFFDNEISEKEKKKWMKKVESNKVKEGEEPPKSEVDKVWDQIVNGSDTYDSKLSKYGWDRSFFEALTKCNEEGHWDDNTWMKWSNLLIHNRWLITNTTAVMIHELLHVLLNHLTRVGKRDPLQWNLATDYAINQVCRFTDELRKVTITRANETFFKRFIISVVKYLSIDDKDIRKAIKKKYKVDLTDDLEKYVEALEPHTAKLWEQYMAENQGWGNIKDKFDNKSAEEYYRILEETCMFVDLEEELKQHGYDSHQKWGDPGDTDGDQQGQQGQQGQEGEGEGEGEGQGQSGQGSASGDSDGESSGQEPGDGGSGGGQGKGSDKKNNKEGGGSGENDDLIQKKYRGKKGKKGQQANCGDQGDTPFTGGTQQSGSPDHEKVRGKGEGEGPEHGGFRDISASARQEAKSAVREAMERSGYNPDDPAEIERALQRIPGMDKIGALVMEWFKIKTVDWRRLLSRHLINCINPTELDYTMTRERRGRDGVFPGKRRDRGLDCVIAADTSGSISHKDWNDFINQIEKIVKDCDIDKLRFIQCHHTISFDKKVNMRRIKKVPIVETGGTTMRVVYEKLKEERNRKLLILFTDGYIDHFLQEDYPFKSIMFLSRGCEGQKESLEERGFTVICQDDE